MRITDTEIWMGGESRRCVPSLVCTEGIVGWLSQHANRIYKWPLIVPLVKRSVPDRRYGNGRILLLLSGINIRIRDECGLMLRMCTSLLWWSIWTGPSGTACGGNPEDGTVPFYSTNWAWNCLEVLTSLFKMYSFLNTSGCRFCGCCVDYGINEVDTVVGVMY